MPSFCQLFSAVLLAATVAAAGNSTSGVVPPGLQGKPYSSANVLDPDAAVTSTTHIESTVNKVDQKGGATDDTPPGQPVADTVTTVVDGQLTNNTGAARRSSWSKRELRERLAHQNKRDVAKRLPSGYEQVFGGTGTGRNDRDSSIQGTAYLTYTVVPNSTYNVDACLAFCDRVPECVFANLYYEFNNDLLDFVFSEKSNLKCVLYADTHNATEKTNKGGQQSEAPPAGLTYIQQSSGYAATTLADPTTPDGYELVFGPTNGANNAPGYMGFAFIDKYDVKACADLCNGRGADPNGGACQYFNIWRALVNGVPTTYTCSMYYIPADASTAVNYGQGDLEVTYSRGYRRKSVLTDGGFEGFTCDDGGDFCFTQSYSGWKGITPSGGIIDASIFHYSSYAHSGSNVGLLGEMNEGDTLPGTLTPASPLETTAGSKYTITFFHWSGFGSPDDERSAYVDVMWNGQVLTTIKPGFSPWTYHELTATAAGKDVLAFRGGKAPAWSFIDDVYVFQI